jgi:hypothetical protein
LAESYWDHIEPFWDAVSIYNGAGVFLKQFGRMPEHAGHLFAVHWCISEVCNGGFHQFFCNSTGVLAPEAVAGFKAVDMPKTAELVAEAMARLPQPYPRDRFERQEALDGLEPELDDDDWKSPFDDLDGRFFDLYDSENGGWDGINRYAAQFPIPRRTGLFARLLSGLRR